MKRAPIYIKGILTLFLFFYSDYFTYIPIFLFKINIKNASANTNVLLQCFASLMLAIVLLLLYYKDLKKEWKIFKDDFRNNVDIGFQYWLLGLGVMVISNLILRYLVVHDIASNEQSVQNLIHISPWIMLINAGVLAPIIEEICFRKTFRDMIPNKWAFVLTSGIFFGFLHVASSSNILSFLYIIPYSALGIAFALMYQKTKTVFTSMSMHFFHNTILILLSILPSLLSFIRF